MNSNILVGASALSDQDLLARLEGLACSEREASAELVAHLAALDMRPALYAAEGYGSLFSYCTRGLRLSEDAACTRIEAARACRRFPLILDLLASGSLSLSAVRMLGKHLTTENHESVLGRAGDRTLREIEALVAELAPRPDLPSTVRKVPCFTERLAPSSEAGPAASSGSGPAPQSALQGVQLAEPSVAPSGGCALAMTGLPSAADNPIARLPSALPTTPLPIVKASAPGRYRVQFTIGQETHQKLRRLQSLLRREIPDGDPGVIFQRALTVLIEKVENEKLAATAKPRPTRPIRPGTDREGGKPGLPCGPVPPGRPSRTVPREVKRAVWARDGGQCAFVSTAGRRCSECTFLEFHHLQPYANNGPATVANISLRCWRHNQYEAELIFGPHGPSIAREACPRFGGAGSDRAELST